MKYEIPVNSERARHILGGDKPYNCGGKDAACIYCNGTGRIPTPWGHTRMSALKRAMGVTKKEGEGHATGGRYFLVSDVLKFLKNNPTWVETQVYKRKKPNQSKT